MKTRYVDKDQGLQVNIFFYNRPWIGLFGNHLELDQLEGLDDSRENIWDLNNN